MNREGIHGVYAIDITNKTQSFNKKKTIKVKKGPLQKKTDHTVMRMFATLTEITGAYTIVIKNHYCIFYLKISQS
jgi:hypothetical protein